MKQKIHIIEFVIRTGIAYGFYGIAFSLPTIKRFDKILIRLQKSICDLPKSTPNVTTQLPHHLFGLKAFSLKNAYLRCIGNQLKDALNDNGMLGNIYRGLTNYIFALHGGAENPKITIAACLRSPTTKTIYLLKSPGGLHIRSTLEMFPKDQTPLEVKWLQQRMLHPYIKEKASLSNINKLYLLHITDITQLTQPCGTKLMSLKDLVLKFEETNISLKRIHKNLQIQFCESICTPQCPNNCTNHKSPLTLLPQFLLPSQPPLPDIQTTNDEIPTINRPPSQIWKQIKNTQPNSIITHRIISKKV